MWAHVAKQMKLPGGLGMKREDWVERMHQDGRNIREQHRAMLVQEQRAERINKSGFRDSHPAVMKVKEEVLTEAARGPQIDREKRADERRAARIDAREKALERWEVAQGVAANV